MSSTSTPIPLHRFAEAIADLPLSNLHFKAAEIRNSVAHLESSNQELQIFADEGDQDCADAVKENREVIGRMEERMLLLRREVERRGFRWGADDRVEFDGDAHAHGNGDAGMVGVNGEAPVGLGESREGAQPAGQRLGNEELARRLRERMEEDGQDGEDGVHL